MKHEGVVAVGQESSHNNVHVTLNDLVKRRGATNIYYDAALPVHDDESGVSIEGGVGD